MINTMIHVVVYLNSTTSTYKTKRSKDFGTETESDFYHVSTTEISDKSKNIKIHRKNTRLVVPRNVKNIE